MAKAVKPDTDNQIKAFRKTARDLSADESEENFNAALSKISQQKQIDPEKRPPGAKSGVKPHGG